MQPDRATETLGEISSKVRGLIAKRRARFRYFNEDLFADPFWDIALELFCAETEGSFSTVTSAIEASGVSTGTAHRHLSYLIDQGMICTFCDAGDKRTKRLRLSDEQFDRLLRYLVEIDFSAA